MNSGGRVKTLGSGVSTLLDIAFWQSLIQLGNACVGDLGAEEND